MSLSERKIALSGAVIVTILLWLMLFPVKAFADNTCWTSGQGSFSFGSVSTREKATTSMSVTATCQGSYGKEVWFRVCLSPETETLEMNTNTYPVYSLNFQVFTATDLINPLYTDNPAQLTMKAEDNQSVSGMFRLVGRIVSGQNNSPAMDYFNYYFPLIMRWSSADREDLLPSCSAGTTVAPYPVSATTTIKNTCMIGNVSSMNFGTLLGGQTPTLSGTAQSSIVIQCPVSTAYSVGLDNGRHFNGAQRQLCSENGECVNYTLSKDKTGTYEWGNIPGVNTLNVSSSTGDYASHIVYGSLPPQEWPSPGKYTDTVVVTLRY
ncbi:Csu type fimbrial protein [Citrobacter koseri]|uniref:Csu type fimbrial protein n=1 Tax=Citrobacter koseri TaxID=545 RepID=UPI00389230B8